MHQSTLISAEMADEDLRSFIQKIGYIEAMPVVTDPGVLNLYFFVNKYGKRLTEQSVRCMINSYCQTCGISMHITPHMFRHSFATLLLEQDVDIRYIQKLLGHSSITTTQIYTHVTSAKQKEIIKTKHPRNNLNIS